MFYKKLFPLLIFNLLLILREDIFAQYIDPGTGSYLFQLIMAGVLAFIFFFRRPIMNLKLFFKKILNKHNKLNE
jgi:hypothetical protein